MPHQRELAQLAGPVRLMITCRAKLYGNLDPPVCLYFSEDYPVTGDPPPQKTIKNANRSANN